jgi:hypothetical protein
MHRVAGSTEELFGKGDPAFFDKVVTIARSRHAGRAILGQVVATHGMMHGPDGADPTLVGAGPSSTRQRGAP